MIHLKGVLGLSMILSLLCMQDVQSMEINRDRDAASKSGADLAVCFLEHT